jgi:hypothetical protein
VVVVVVINARKYNGDSNMSSSLVPSPPKELLCPITQELFLDPVLAEDGHTYERSAVVRWFDTGNARSPVTNEELAGRTVLPNHALRKLVDAYRAQLGVALLAVCAEEEEESRAEERARALVEAGADVDARDARLDTPLTLAVAKNRAGVVSALLAAGADPTAANDRNETAEVIAKKRRLDEALVEALREAQVAWAAKKAADSEARLRERDEYRRLQEARRVEASRLEAQRGSQLVQGVGFFPSLFGLQFQGALSQTSHVPFPRPDPNNNLPATGDAPTPYRATASIIVASQYSLINSLKRIAAWCRESIIGDPELSPQHEDYLQQQFLSRVLLTMGSAVLLCLLLF